MIHTLNSEFLTRPEMAYHPPKHKAFNPFKQLKVTRLFIEENNIN